MHAPSERNSRSRAGMPSAGADRRARILFLLTDGYGGHGGIAAYNRDVIQAMCEDPRVGEVVALPRFAPGPLGELPPGLDFDLAAARGQTAFLRTAFRHAFSGPRLSLIWCAHVNLAPLAWLLSKLTGAPWVLCMYGAEVWAKTGRPLVDRAVPRADGYASISRVTWDRFAGVWDVAGRHRAILPNAIRLDRFADGPRSMALADRLGVRGKTVLMTLGRMDPRERAKGFDRIIELLPRLAKAVPDIRYLACGEGGDRPRLERLAADLGVADRVVFPGMIEEAEKADYFRLADLYVMPSTLEGFGFVFLEALACGVPVVASAIDGGREAVLDGRLGEVVDPFDPEALERAILSGLARPRRIPPELADFAFGRFRDRLSRALDPFLR